jgi:ribokinase
MPRRVIVALDIVAIGHLINETIVYPGKESKSVLGSPVAYSMACAAALGKRVGISSRIGMDYPERLLAPLVELGVDLRGVIREGAVSTNNLLEYDESGNKSIRYLDRAPLIERGDIPPEYCNAEILYVCPMDWDMKADTVEFLSRCNGLLAADLGGFGGAHSPIRDSCQLERDPESLRKVVSALNIVKASDEDCRRIAGRPDLPAEEFSEQLLEWGAEVVVITLGAAGALIVTSRGPANIPPLPGKPIDPTGGGDSFMAGFLVNYLDTRDPQEAGLFGAATALHVIEGTGGVVASRMPRLQQIEVRLQSYREFVNR